MTEDEVQENMNKLIHIQAPGTKEGKQQIRIINYEPNENSPWGKGAVTIEFPEESNRGQIKQSIHQLELANGRVKKRKKRRKAKVG